MYAKYSKMVDNQRQQSEKSGDGNSTKKPDSVGDVYPLRNVGRDPDSNPIAEGLYDLLHADNQCKSLLKKALTPSVYNKLKCLNTKFNGMLQDCIRSGCENTDSGVGVYACDPDGYTVFAPLLDEVIKDYHKVDKLSHPEPDFGDLEKLGFGDLDKEKKYIVSTRVRVGRSHDSYGFPPVLNKEQRMSMEAMTKTALEKLEGEHKGTYFPLQGMSKDIEEQLVADHFLFRDSDRFLRAASGYDDWPHGRGIFHNKDKTFLIWVNEEDHLRLISMQMGGDLGEVYSRLVKGIRQMEKSGLSFAKRDGLGYLTFCPSNLGTALRASVHIKIPKLSAIPEFKAFCDNLHIQARGIDGEHTESKGGVYDISNKRRLGLTEFQAIQEMRKGVEECIKKEASLKGGNVIDNMETSKKSNPGDKKTESSPGNKKTENSPDNKNNKSNSGNKKSIISPPTDVPCRE